MQTEIQGWINPTHNINKLLECFHRAALKNKTNLKVSPCAFVVHSSTFSTLKMLLKTTITL